jgi:hypothetical protein
LNTVNAVARVALGKKGFPRLAVNHTLAFVDRLELVIAQHLPLGGIPSRAIGTTGYCFFARHDEPDLADRDKDAVFN